MPDRTVTNAAVAGALPEISTAARFFPLLFFEAYLIVSLLSFTYGPHDWNIDNSLAVLSYALLGQILIGAGYWVGSAQGPRGLGVERGDFVNITLKVAIILTLVLLPPTISTRNSANLSLLEALADPGAAYQARAEAQFDYLWLSVIRTLLSPVLSLLLPLGIVFWRCLNLPWRGLWLAATSGVAIVPLFTGRAFGIFDITLTAPWLLWIAVSGVPARARLNALPEHRRKRAILWRRALVAVFVVSVAIPSLAYFSYSRQSRGGEAHYRRATGWSEEQYGISLPEAVEYDVYYVTRYLSLGYYGLSGSLRLPFEWTGGIGHSAFLRRYAAMVSSDLEWIDEATYPARLEAVTGYSSTGSWHTIYPWIASDLTFPGALVFVGLMAFLFARAWSDALMAENPFALGFLSQIMLMFWYIPANNLRLANPEAAFAFYGLLALWLVTRAGSTTGNG